MKIVSKVLALALVLVLMFSLAACGGEKTVDVVAVKEQIITDLKIEDPKDLPAERLLNRYGIETSDVESSACFFTSGTVFDDEVIMITAVSEEAKDRVEEKVNARLENFLKQAKNYSPENYAVAKECKVLTYGNTVALFLSYNHTQMEEIFNSNCK